MTIAELLPLKVYQFTLRHAVSLLSLNDMENVPCSLCTLLMCSLILKLSNVDNHVKLYGYTAILFCHIEKGRQIS